MKYWLLKSEPTSYSIDDMKRDKTMAWEGVRNYQARNFMQKEMTVGDHALFYHSSADTTGVAGLVEVSSAAAPDKSAFDPKSTGFDKKSDLKEPTWYCVQVKFLKKFDRIVTLADIKANKKLSKMVLVQKGSRLSIQPVTKEEFQTVLSMAGE